LHREVKSLLELLLSSTREDLEVRRVNEYLVFKSKSRGLEVIVEQKVQVRVASLLFYVYELTSNLYKSYSSTARRLRELREYINAELYIYIVDCDEDTRVFTSIIEALVENLNYTVERAVNIASLLIVLSRDVGIVKKFQTKTLSELEYTAYQEAFGRVAGYLKQLEILVQSSEDLARILDIVGEITSRGATCRGVLETILTSEGFTRVYYVSTLLRSCPSILGDVVRELYESMWFQENIYILAPSVLKVLLKRIIPREQLIELS